MKIVRSNVTQFGQVFVEYECDQILFTIEMPSKDYRYKLL